MNASRRAAMRSAMLFASSTVLVAQSTVFGQALVASDPTSDAPALGYDFGNGIAVGDPKLYDDRSLQIMLSTYEKNLQSANFFNQSAVAANLNNIQGGTASSNNSSFNLTTTPTPGSVIANTLTQPTQSTVANSGGTNVATFLPAGQTTVPATAGTTTTTNGPTTVTNNGAATGNTVTTTTTPVGTNPVPALNNIVNPFTVAPAFGLASADILDAQTQLQFQVTNLRLLLQQAVSDRVGFTASNSTPTQTGQDIEPSVIAASRGHIVMGFDVCIDAGYQQQDAAAEVEITVEPSLPGAKGPTPSWDVSSDRIWNSARQQPPKLGLLLPMEKTYNVATITQDTHAIGLGAVAVPISLGYNSASTKQAFYLVRDTDTVALTKLKSVDPNDPNSTNSLTFGWEFRPVLGKHIVEPGTRRVYAYLSLPTSDSLPYGAHIIEHTFWRHMNDKRGSLAETPVQQSGPDVKQPRTWDIVVPSDADLDTALRPTVSNVSFSENTDGLVYVNVQGTHFLQGTSVAVGDNILSTASNNLVIRGEQALQFLVPEQQLVLNSPVIVGPYGVEVPIDSPAQGNGIDPASGRMGITDVHIDPLDTQNSIVTTTISLTGALPLRSRYAYFAQKSTSASISASDLRGTLVATIGSTVYGLNDNPFLQLQKNKDGTFQFSMTVPTQVLRQARYLTAEMLFDGPAYRDSVAIDDHLYGLGDFTASTVTLLSTNDTGPVYAIAGAGFTKRLHVNIGPVEFTTTDPVNKLKVLAESDHDIITDTDNTHEQIFSLATFNPTYDQVKNATAIAVYQKNSPAIVIALPKSPTEPAKTPKTLTVTSADAVFQGDSKRINFLGTNFNLISAIQLGNGTSKELTWKSNGSSGTSLYIFLSKEMTTNANIVEIDFVLKDKSIVPYNLQVQAPPKAAS